VDYVTREWDSERIKTRYDWLYEYDARTVDVVSGPVDAVA
jgi:hypothetical protein